MSTRSLAIFSRMLSVFSIIPSNLHQWDETCVFADSVTEKRIPHNKDIVLIVYESLVSIISERYVIVDRL